MKLLKQVWMQMYSHVLKVPSPFNFSYFWNFGSFLLIIMIFQIFSGILLSMYYSNSVMFAFSSLQFLKGSILGGYYLSILHLNGASMLFFLLYVHLFRGMSYGSFKLSNTWNSGVAIFTISMLISFMGYILPWGQMSFWAATVITKFVSAVPFVGNKILQWLWGGFGVEEPTLKIFFTLHFLVPLIVMILIMVHFAALHFSGSTNPMVASSSLFKIKFSPQYLSKDLLNLGFIFIFCVYLKDVWFSSESENFMKANYFVTPSHIKPEWYFLFTYAILRSIPHKLGGVILMIVAILMFMSLSLIYNKYSSKAPILMFSVFGSFFILSWIGGQEPSDHMLILGLIFTSTYFLSFILYLMSMFIINLLI